MPNSEKPRITQYLPALAVTRQQIAKAASASQNTGKFIPRSAGDIDKLKGRPLVADALVTGKGD